MKGASSTIVGHYFIHRPNEIIIKESRKKKSHTYRNEPFKITSKDDKNNLLGKLNIAGSL